jgi:hypothetical protein
MKTAPTIHQGKSDTPPGQVPAPDRARVVGVLMALAGVSLAALALIAAGPAILKAYAVHFYNAVLYSFGCL